MAYPERENGNSSIERFEECWKVLKHRLRALPGIAGDPPWSQQAVLDSIIEELAAGLENLREEHHRCLATAERTAEERVLARERQFTSIFTESPIGIAYYASDGRLLDVNPACRTLFGIERQADLTDFRPLDKMDFTGRVRERLRRGESGRAILPVDLGPAGGEQAGTTGKSGVIYLDVIATPIRSPGSGSLKGWLVHFQDITERILLEEIRSHAYDQIERNIEQFAILADHVRHPLQVIIGMADLIEDERTDVIVQQVHRINGIIRDLDRGWVESRKIREFLRRNESCA
jgi:PAS domain S-box-containing protein